jgi:hypothetical protein
MKKMLVLGALALGLAFAGETIAKADCYPATNVGWGQPVYYGYRYPHRRVVRRIYVRPTYYNHYGYRAYDYRPRVAIGVGF